MQQTAVVQDLETGRTLNLVSSPPPKGFRPSGRIGAVRWHTGTPNFAKGNTGGSAAQRAGISFENKVQRRLIDFHDNYWPGPWITFSAPAPGNLGTRWCQPDGLVVDLRRGFCTIVEIKISHTADAWWQLERLYRPVVSKLMGENWEIRTVEICKYYDVETVLPERHELVDSIDPPSYTDRMNVLVWPRGEYG